MAISRVPGYSLLANLDRQGTDLYISSNGSTLFYWDVSNYQIGVNTETPQQALHVSGNILAGNGHIYTGANLQFDLGTPTNQWRAIYSSNVYATLATPLQPYITSLGNLSTLTVTGPSNLSNIIISANSYISAGNNAIHNVGDPTANQDVATKAYVDSQVAVANAITGNVIELGTPTDGNLSDNNAAYLGFTTLTSVTDAIDILNSVTQNLFTNTFVRTVSFSSNVTAGGAGQTILLTMVPQGNVNQYVIQWGDGSSNTTTSSTTATHTYATNVGTPFTVIVTANNTNGAMPSNTAGAVRTNYITIYGPDPALGFSTFRANISTTPLSGSNLYSIQGNAFYLQNTTTNTNTATVTWSINWGEGTYANVPNNSSAGGVLGPYATKTYTSNSGASSFTVNLALLTSDITNPAILPRYTSTSLKVYSPTPPIPNGVNTRSLSYSGSVGTTPYLAASSIDNTGGTTLAAGASVNRATTTQATISTSGTITTTTTYNANVGILSAIINGAYGGSVNLATQTSTIVTGNLGLSSIADYNLRDQAGAVVAFASSIYYPGLYYGFTANVVSSGPRLPLGVNRFGVNHTTTGSTGNVDFVVDDITSAPTVVAGNIAIRSPGTYRYVSGIPYFNTGSPTLWLQDVTINSWIGQAYTNTTNVAYVAMSNTLESSSGNIILANAHPYTSLSNSSATMLSGGIPIAGTGNVAAYKIANLIVAINPTSTIRSVGNIGIVVNNVNGASTATPVTTKRIQVHTAAQAGISEISINVAAALGDATITSNGIRSTYFISSTDNNPSYVNSTDFYTTNIYSESSDPGVAGTKEATLRLGTLKHDITNYSAVFLPPGPNRSSDTGNQFFTFAFRRKVVANFDLNITAGSGVVGVWIAAPGTTIDNTSTLNGWLDASTAYAGSGVPGANTGSGGNGSNGCALTTGDRIQANVALSGGYTMTLGTENMTNATNNVVLVRIALASGQTITALSVGVAA